jgi:hypothetical protein
VPTNDLPVNVAVERANKLGQRVGEYEDGEDEDNGADGPSDGDEADGDAQ